MSESDSIIKNINLHISHVNSPLVEENLFFRLRQAKKSFIPISTIMVTFIA